jgi:hypothetical protein
VPKQPKKPSQWNRGGMGAARWRVFRYHFDCGHTKDAELHPPTAVGGLGHCWTCGRLRTVVWRVASGKPPAGTSAVT